MSTKKPKHPTKTPTPDEGDDQIPNLFATIHWKSEQRPDGYTPEEVEDINIEINRHIPALYEKLKAQRDERIAREAKAEQASKNPDPEVSE